MAKLQRKTAKLFAEDANAAIGGLAQFGSLASGTPNYSTDPDVIQALDAYKKGWSAAVLGTKSPAMEDRNALDYLLSYQQAYIMQRGIPEYLDTETYYEGSFVSKASGALYVSKVDNNTGHDPALDPTETYWMKFPTPAEVAANYVAKAGDTMTGALTVQANITSTGDVSAANVTASTKMTTATPDTTSNDTTVPTTAWVRTYFSGAIVNMMNKINTNAGVGAVINSNTSYTCPANGWVVISPSGSAQILVGGVALGSGLEPYSMPVIYGTVIRNTSSTSSAQVAFFPELV